jgi:outer membrane protein TolC
VAVVEQSWDALRVVLDLPRDQWTRPILPLDVPRFDATPPPSVDDALATAMTSRPDFAQMRLDREATELAIRKAQNDRLPQIDLSVGATLSGQDSSASGALSEVMSAYSPTWTAGVTLTWTPLHRASSTAVELARIQREVRLENQQQRVEQVWSDVRGAVRGRSNAALEVTTAARARELATAALEIENRKYVSGTSSATALAQKQQELAGDELAELQALIGNAHADTALLVATGRLLEARHVELTTSR